MTFLHDRISQLHEEAGEHAVVVVYMATRSGLASLAASGQVRAVYE